MTLYSLQLLRFIAAILVLLFHLNLVRSGYKGVDIFFVISGFIMYYTLYSETRPAAFRFMINRFTKIFFLYWTALCLLYIIAPYTINFLILKTLFLIPGHYSVLGVSWSLSYELYFYLLIGTIVYMMPGKLQIVSLYLLLFISSIITILNLTPFSLKGSFINFLAGANLWEFFLGIFCARLLFPNFKILNSFYAFLILSASFLLLLLVNIQYANPYSYIVYGLLSFLIIYFLIGLEKKMQFKKAFSLFKILGDASYAIYLFGPIVTLFIGAAGLVSKTSIIAITIVFSIAFNQLVENPFLSWSRKRLYKLVPQKAFKNTSPYKNKISVLK